MTIEFKPIEAKEFPIYDHESIEMLYELIGELTLSFPYDKSGRKNFFYYQLEEE